MPRGEVNVAIHKLLVGDLDLLEAVVGIGDHPLPLFYWVYSYRRGNQLQLTYPMKAGNQELLLKRILRSPELNSWNSEQREYAARQARRIYSEELAQTISNKKYLFKAIDNQKQIEEKFDRHKSSKATIIATNIEKSIERKHRLLSDKVKVYQTNDKRWFSKKEQIRQKEKDEDKSMLEVANAYRIKSQAYWREREKERKQLLKDFSSKYHHLYNSNIRATTQPESTVTSNFDEDRLQRLLEKRKTKFQEFKNSRHKKERSTTSHLQRERKLRETEQQQRLQKTIERIKHTQANQKKREEKRRHESIQRAKRRLNQRVYSNNRPDIGQDCSKFDKNNSNFRSRTLSGSKGDLSPSSVRRTAISRSSSLSQHQRMAKEEGLRRYYQKANRLKVTRILKMNIRNAIHSQLKQDSPHNPLKNDMSLRVSY